MHTSLFVVDFQGGAQVEVHTAQAVHSGFLFPGGPMAWGRTNMLDADNEIRFDIRPPVMSPSSGQYALQFDGVDDHVTLPIRYDGSHPLTFEVWCDPSVVPEGQSPQITSIGPLNLKIYDEGQGLTWQTVVWDEQAQQPLTSHWLPYSVGRTHLASQWDGESVALYVNGRRATNQYPSGGTIGARGAEVFQEASNWLVTVGTLSPIHEPSVPPSERLDLSPFYYAGTMNEIRVSRIARYADDFNPPEHFTDDGDTLALYEFEDGQGGTLRDTSGNGHDGTIYGATWVRADATGAVPESPQPAADDFALQFDGNGQRVEVPSLAWDGTTPLTIEAWIESPFENQYPMTIMYLEGKSAWHLRTDRTADGQKSWASDLSGDSQATYIYYDQPITLKNQPIHIAAVLDDTMHRVFQNGRLLREKPHEHSWTTTGEGRGLSLGMTRFQDAWRYQFSGWMDEVRISRSARYATDFTPDRRFVADAETLALYHCDAGTGSILRDDSGNGHDGTIVGATWSRVESPDVVRLAAAYSALRFTTTDAANPARIDVPNGFDFTGPCTIEMFVTPASIADQRMNRLLFMAYPSLGLKQYEDDWQFAVIEPTVEIVRAKEAVRADERTHLAAVSTGREVRLFVNGVLAQTLTLTRTDRRNDRSHFPRGSRTRRGLGGLRRDH
jgi:hypothetical protein